MTFENKKHFDPIQNNPYRHVFYKSQWKLIRVSKVNIYFLPLCSWIPKTLYVTFCEPLDVKVIDESPEKSNEEMKKICKKVSIEE
jgi:hypothetical protein